MTRYVRTELRTLGTHVVTCTACDTTAYPVGDLGYADRHARTCKPLATALERDSLRAEVDKLQESIATFVHQRRDLNNKVQTLGIELDALGIERDLLRAELAAVREQLAQALKAQPADAPKTKPAPKVCSFPDCGRKVIGRGLCAGHYDQQRRGKDLTPIRARRKPTTADETPAEPEPAATGPRCTVTGCDREPIVKGLCAPHYNESRHPQPTTAAPAADDQEGEPVLKPVTSRCTFDGCRGVVKAKDLCKAHYQQLRRGNPLSPLRTPTNEPKPDNPALVALRKLVNRSEWVEDALCAQVDPELWYSEKGGSTREAKRICKQCPVRVQCLEEAMAAGDRHGIWGGLSERERAALARERAGAQEAPVAA